MYHTPYCIADWFHVVPPSLEMATQPTVFAEVLMFQNGLMAVMKCGISVSAEV
jgi:hypothetical protein